MDELTWERVAEGTISGGADTSAPWWTATIDYIARASADARYRTPQLQAGQYYMRDQYGRVVPAGYPTVGGAMQTPTAVPSWAVFAGIALAGVLLFKLAK